MKCGLVALIIPFSLILPGISLPSSTCFISSSRPVAKAQGKLPKQLLMNNGFLKINTDQIKLSAENDEEGDMEPTSSEGNFDGKGFAGYIAPYLAAFIVSIAVTAAFLKFVLLDY